MTSEGCGPTSTAIFLSGYNKDNSDPLTIAAEMDALTDKTIDGITYEIGTNNAKIIKVLKDRGIAAQAFDVNTEEDKENAITNIKEALSAGKPVIIGLLPNNGGRYNSSSSHKMCITKINSDGSIIISNPGRNDSDVAGNTCESVEAFAEFLIGGSYVIPDTAPTGAGYVQHELEGFKEGLEIQSPQKGVIKELGKIENEEESSGEGSEETAVDYYATEGDYVIIEFKDTGTGVDGWKMRIEGFDAVSIAEGQLIEKGEQIGLTNNKNIRIILYDAKDAIINDVEDYFKLKTRKTRSLDTNQYEFFFFVYYESGLMNQPGSGPENVGACERGIEHGVGICQWTTRKGRLSNIQKVCEKLYNLDSSLCAPLQKYIGMSDDELIDNYAMSPSFENSQLRQDFSSICATDRERFLQLQMQIGLEEKYQLFDDLGLSWIKDRPYVVQGTLASFVNWGSGLGWEDCINESMNDEEIIIALSKYACTMTSTVGPLNSRWNPQAKAAIDILNGELDAEKFLTDESYGVPYSTGGEYVDFLSTR